MNTAWWYSYSDSWRRVKSWVWPGFFSPVTYSSCNMAELTFEKTLPKLRAVTICCELWMSSAEAADRLLSSWRELAPSIARNGVHTPSLVQFSPAGLLLINIYIYILYYIWTCVHFLARRVCCGWHLSRVERTKVLYNLLFLFAWVFFAVRPALEFVCVCVVSVYCAQSSCSCQRSGTCSAYVSDCWSVP